MSVAATKLAAVGPLRVAVEAADLARRSAWSRLVAEWGHVVVADRQTANVILSDGRLTDPGERPTVVIGEGDGDVAGVLSPEEVGTKNLPPRLSARRSKMPVNWPFSSTSVALARQSNDAGASKLTRYQ
jgi:hypothetical protein